MAARDARHLKAGHAGRRCEREGVRAVYGERPHAACQRADFAHASAGRFIHAQVVVIAAPEVDEAPVSRHDRVVRPGASANRSDDRAVGGLEDVPDAARTVLAARHVQPAGVRTYSTGVDAAVQMDRPDDAFGEQVVGQHRAVAVATAVAAVGDEEHVR